MVIIIVAIIVIIFFYTACINLIDAYKISPEWAFIIGLFASWIVDVILSHYISLV